MRMVTAIVYMPDSIDRYIAAHIKSLNITLFIDVIGGLGFSHTYILKGLLYKSPGRYYGHRASCMRSKFTTQETPRQ